jgi:TonB-linked SusC/RagA family outer membrane protein
MKLTAIFLIAAFLQVSGKSFSQQVTIHHKNISIEKVLQLIEDQSSYHFLFKINDLSSSRNVDLELTNVSVEQALDQCFKNTAFTYKIINRTILVKKTVDLPDRAANNSFVLQKIQGVVTDEKGAPLPGVTIKLKGTTTGTITDTDGKFTLEVSDANSTLIVSFIGFTSQEVLTNGRNVLNIRLKEAPKDLGEIVVVGYGQQRKATLTGSISTVSGKEITQSPAPNVVSSLAGKLPGLVVNQRSGQPGADDPSIIVRGVATFYNGGSGSGPLIIVDGVERTIISRLNPNDIESISVLKDGSAAIYGARAANGVILITTKRGKKGRPDFSFSYNYALQSPTKVPKVLDAATFAQVYNEGNFYRQSTGSTYTTPPGYQPFYSDAAIQAYRDGSDPINFPNTDWAGVTLKNHSFVKNYNMQVIGGSDNVHYLFSFGKLKQDGGYVHDPQNYTQYNFRSKVDVDINKYLNIGANLSGTLDTKAYSTVASNVQFINILQANPTITAIYPNGLIGPGRLGENPLLIDQRGYDNISETPLYSTFTASFKVPHVDGLKIDASYNYDLDNVFEKRWNIPYFYYQYNVNTKNYDRIQGSATGTTELTDTYSKYTTTLSNIRVSYDHNFRNHHVAAMVGKEQQQNTFSGADAYRKNFLTQALPQINYGSSVPADQANGGSASSSARNNYFGRFNYDLDAKYLVEFLFRYDGSPIFPSNNRYGFFPGASVGWRLSEEKFIKDRFPFINQLKLRATYGEIGNDRVGTYNYLQAYNFGQNYVFGSTDAPGIYSNVLPNPNIHWEVSKKTDFGLESELWNGLLGVDFTYYLEKRSNILAIPNLSVSQVLGFPALPAENIGKMDNHGFELSVSTRSKIGEVTYSIAANLNYNRSKIIYQDEVPPQEPYQGFTGHPFGAGMYYKADGIFHTQAELDAYPHDPNTRVGDVKMLDLNHDGKIDSKDQFTFDGSVLPRYTFGLNMNFAYKSFDLNVFLQGQAAAWNYDNTFASLGTTDFANAAVERAQNRWTVSNPNGTMPRSDGYQPGNSTFYLFNASFVRLKTVQLGYTLPQNVVSKIGMNNLRFFMSGFNVITWAKQISWADPELNGGYTTYPQQRIINFGATVKF